MVYPQLIQAVFIRGTVKPSVDNYGDSFLQG